jgi:predicted dehydrogenase
VPEPLRIAILGAGMVARYHAQAIAATPGTRLVAVSRFDASKAAASASEFSVPCETSEEALLARPDVDAVCICTPSGQHARETIAAARAGKHVLVEKPMALNLADADAMVEACRSAGVVLAVALQRRTEPAYQLVHRAIQDGLLGRPVLGMAVIPYFRSKAYYDSAVWRGTWKEDGGGALMNQGIHIADLLAWFMGDVEEVFARAATLAHEIEVEDDVVATVRFKSGALGSIVATTAAAPGFPHRVEIYGSRGGVQLEAELIARWEGESVPTIDPALRAGSAPAAAGAGSSPTGIAPTGHARILADFVAAIREGRPPLVPGAEARRSLQLVLAVYEAARTARPVRIP